MRIPKMSRWDGSSKAYTKNCNTCEAYRKITGKELCGWGIAFKYLERTANQRKCELINKKQPQNNSLKYLDKLIKQIERGLDEFGIPNQTGIYLIDLDGEKIELEVYEHPKKGLCYFTNYLGSGGCNDGTNTHTPINRTGLEFIQRLRDLD